MRRRGLGDVEIARQTPEMIYSLYIVTVTASQRRRGPPLPVINTASRERVLSQPNHDASLPKVDSPPQRRMIWRDRTKKRQRYAGEAGYFKRGKPIRRLSSLSGRFSSHNHPPPLVHTLLATEILISLSETFLLNLRSFSSSHSIMLKSCMRTCSHSYLPSKKESKVPTANGGAHRLSPFKFKQAIQICG